MEVNVTYETQHLWTTWFAIYLYLGGLGAATMTVTFLTDMYLKSHKPLAIWGALAGLLTVGGGSALLFIHLANHAAVVYVLNPLAIFIKPDAWIAWGTQFISWMLIAGTLYVLPYIAEEPLFKRLPVVGSLLQTGILQSFARMIGNPKGHQLLGIIASLSGIGVAVYTGLLLQSFPAVALWNNPGVPILFTVSAFSTACALLILVIHIFMGHNERDSLLRKLYESTDLGLIAVELLIIFLFYMYLTRGSMSARVSADLLFHDWGWLLGFVGLGLIAPFLIELRSVLTHGQGHNRLPTIAAAVFVLIGGFLLRDYFMAAGIYVYPT
ncbi:Polysulfide reductase, subunit C, putative [invertebrate metagenome]|uniref:Polysulfide reductase, subunit C, putative n=1 Tax=invertebrate metagenome TaxID=1711999 RepID=A0A484HD74_9ZZZZ